MGRNTPEDEPFLVPVIHQVLIYSLKGRDIYSGLSESVIGKQGGLKSRFTRKGRVESHHRIAVCCRGFGIKFTFLFWFSVGTMEPEL